jgi:hypothetical protein
MRDRPLSATLRRTIGESKHGLPDAPASALSADASVDDLARAATGGDVEAVGRLYDALVGPIYRYIAVRLRRREDAEDVTQLVFERIVGALPPRREAVRGMGLPDCAQRGHRPSATSAADGAARRDRRASRRCRAGGPLPA